MTFRPLHSLLAAALIVPVLAGCSHDDSGKTAAQAPAASYAAVARGRVDIEGGLLKLSMPREGVVASIKVHEGMDGLFLSANPRAQVGGEARDLGVVLTGQLRQRHAGGLCGRDPELWRAGAGHSAAPGPEARH